MSSTVLQTKLHLPPARSGYLSRPRLIKKLSGGLAGKLTLISAQAGFDVFKVLFAEPQAKIRAILGKGADSNDFRSSITFFREFDR